MTLTLIVEADQGKYEVHTIQPFVQVHLVDHRKGQSFNYVSPVERDCHLSSAMITNIDSKMIFHIQELSN